MLTFLGATVFIGSPAQASKRAQPEAGFETSSGIPSQLPISFIDVYKILQETPTKITKSSELQKAVVYYIYNNFFDAEEESAVLKLIPHLKEKAQQDPWYAQAFITLQGVEDLPASVITCLQSHAAMGDPMAQDALGWICWLTAQGETGENKNKKKLKEAVSWWEKAAAQENAQALCALGQVYLPLPDKKIFGAPLTQQDMSGILQKDLNKALTYFQRSSEQGYNPASYFLGNIYYYNIAPWDYKTAFHFYKKSVAQGNPNLPLWLGHIYEQGIEHQECIIYPSLKKAVFFYKKAASLRNPEAYYALGNLYLHGDENHADDVEQAMAYYKDAAALGHLKASYKLGLIHVIGTDERAPNLKQAISAFTAPAKAGHAKSQTELALIYDEHLEDSGEATWWYLQAACQRNDLAKNNLSQLVALKDNFFAGFPSLEEYQFNENKYLSLRDAVNELIRFNSEYLRLGYPPISQNDRVLQTIKINLDLLKDTFFILNTPGVLISCLTLKDSQGHVLPKNEIEQSGWKDSVMSFPEKGCSFVTLGSNNKRQAQTFLDALGNLDKTTVPLKSMVLVSPNYEEHTENTCIVYNIGASLDSFVQTIKDEVYLTVNKRNLRFFKTFSKAFEQSEMHESTVSSRENKEDRDGPSSEENTLDENISSSSFMLQGHNSSPFRSSNSPTHEHDRLQD